MRGGNALPAAIFASAIVIALGIYFGLRAQKADAGAAAALAPSAASSESAALADASSQRGTADPPPRVVGAPANPLAEQASAAPADDPRAREARAALEKLRPKFVEACWKPSAQKKKDPPSAKYEFMLAFDAAGRERARGISDVGFGDATRIDVGDCLRNLASPISIAPANAPVTVEVTLTLP